MSDSMEIKNVLKWLDATARMHDGYNEVISARHLREVRALVAELVSAAAGSLNQTEANQRDGLVPTIYYTAHIRLAEALVPFGILEDDSDVAE